MERDRLKRIKDAEEGTFMQASINSAQSVIDTNKNQEGFNKSTKLIAISAVIVAAIGLAVPIIDLNTKHDTELRIQVIEQLLLPKRPPQDQIQSQTQPPPYFYLSKSNPSKVETFSIKKRGVG